MLELVPTWVDVETEDALELLGSNYSVAPIRRLALRSLEKISDADLLCFLMPLSVALRYDVVATQSQKSNETTRLNYTTRLN